MCVSKQQCCLPAAQKIKGAAACWLNMNKKKRFYEALGTANFLDSYFISFIKVLNSQYDDFFIPFRVDAVNVLFSIVCTSTQDLAQIILILIKID